MVFPHFPFYVSATLGRELGKEMAKEVVRSPGLSVNHKRCVDIRTRVFGVEGRNHNH
jgi:hypothetical protein